MPVQAIYLITHGIVTIFALVGLAMRLEHRLTKIETDLSWLKNNNKQNCGKENENVEGSCMD